MCRATMCTTIFILFFSKYFIEIQCGVFDIVKELMVKAKDRIHAAIKDSVADVVAAIKDYTYKSFTLEVSTQAKDKVTQAFESVKNVATKVMGK